MKTQKRAPRPAEELRDDKCLMALIRAQQVVMGIEWPWWPLGARVVLERPARPPRKRNQKH